MRWRWWILVAAVLAQIPNANMQYAWTLFPSHIVKDGLGKLSRVQEVFALFVLLETWLVPFDGWLVDKFGPRLLTMAGGVLIGISWVAASTVQTLGGLLFWYGVVGGIGTGLQNQAVENIGIVSRLILPTDGLWRGAVYAMEPDVVLAQLRLAGTLGRANPFSAVDPPPIAFLAWVAVWFATMLALSIWSFRTREI